jgi:hypothetical protein
MRSDSFCQISDFVTREKRGAPSAVEMTIAIEVPYSHAHACSMPSLLRATPRGPTNQRRSGHFDTSPSLFITPIAMRTSVQRKQRGAREPGQHTRQPES